MKAFAATIQNKTLDGTCNVSAAVGSGAVTGASYVTLGNDATLTAERVLTAGDGMALTDSGANGTITLTQDIIDRSRKKVIVYDDFFGDASANNVNWLRVLSGTGSSVSNFGVAETGVFGVWEFSTGTTATGSAGLRLGDLDSFSLGQGLSTFEAYVKLPTLSTAAEEYTFRIGFIDSVTGPGTDGANFRYTQSSSINWKMETDSNSVSTTTTSTTAVGTGWTRLKIVVNAAGTSAAFYVNGTQLSGSPMTTNIPVGVGRELTIATSMVKTVGTTARVARIDYTCLDIDLTTAR